jgi:hypothetical protein
VGLKTENTTDWGQIFLNVIRIQIKAPSSFEYRCVDT